MKDAGIEILIQVVFFEKEGMNYYRKAMEISENPATRGIFELLAEEEKKHVKYLSDLQEMLEAGGEWPDEISINPDVDFKSVFRTAIKNIDSDISVSMDESEGISRALELENKGRRMYLDLAEKASLPAEKRLFSMLADWEKGHVEFLEDYFNYFQDHGMFTQE